MLPVLVSNAMLMLMLYASSSSQTINGIVYVKSAPTNVFDYMSCS
jgi:hypothetical protein